MTRSFIRAAAAAALVAFLDGTALAQTADFLKQEGPDVWRASKLPGVAILGPDGRKVGDITEVLLNHTGKATAVVIGVGGFLGIGEKDVAVPFDQVAFTDRPMNPPQPASVAGGVATTQANGAATPATTGLGMPADTTGNPNAPGARGTAPGIDSAPSSGAGAVVPATGTAGSGPHSTTYPDHGTIALTAEQLKMAPPFQFAR